MNKLLILAADAAKYAALIQAADLQQLEIRSTGDVASANTLIEDCNIILGDPATIEHWLYVVNGFQTNGLTESYQLDFFPPAPTP